MIVFALLVLLVQSVACQDDNSTLFILNLNNFTKTDNNTETENQKCSVGSRNNLPCLCGDSLIMAHELYRKRLLDTCTNYSVTEDMSPFSFCSEALLSLGYNIEKSYVTDDLISNSSFENGTFSNITLAEMISSLKSSMLVFQEVLKRTIVGVLVETEGQRCSCLDSYKKWLCTTGLPFFTNNSNRVVQIKPCLSICHSVLQSCPYYRPSPFQAMIKERVIYGGYPAFDCPKKNRDVTYASCSGHDCLCIREGSLLSHQASVLSHQASRLIITVSIFLFLLIIKIIT